MLALKIAFGVVVGGLVGYFTANELAPYFWWVGMLVGALFGFISCGWREFLLAIPRAWRAAGGRLERHVSRSMAREVTAYAAIFGSTLAWFVIIGFVVVELGVLILNPPHMEHVSLRWAVAAPIATILVILAIVWASFFLIALLVAEDKEFEVKEDEAAWAERLMWRVFPPTGVYLGARWVIRNWPAVLRSSGEGLVEMVLFFGRFGVALWRLTHSDARVVAALGAATFAAVGYHAGSAIIGGAVGLAAALIYWFAFGKRFRPQV